MTKKRLTMSDDLVERARHNANADIPHHASVSLIEEMADRIEELETKLAENDELKAKLEKAMQVVEMIASADVDAVLGEAVDISCEIIGELMEEEEDE